jgi:hypothetical protein
MIISDIFPSNDQSRTNSMSGLSNSNFRNQEFIRGIFSLNQEKNQEFFL